MVHIQQVRISWVYIELDHAAYLNLTKEKSLFHNQIWLIVDYKIFRLFEKFLLAHYVISFHLFFRLSRSLIGLSVWIQFTKTNENSKIQLKSALFVELRRQKAVWVAA